MQLFEGLAISIPFYLLLTPQASQFTLFIDLFQSDIVNINLSFLEIIRNENHHSFDFL